MDEPEIRIAMLDDDPEIRDLVSAYLARYQVACVAFSQVDQFRSRVATESFDLVLLDIMLPDGDGLKIAREIRATTNLPIILLTALADESDRVLGLEMGADDYLTKPFSPRELLARIRAVLRRTTDQLWVHRAQQAQEFHFDGWVLSVPQRSLRAPGSVMVSLTGGEFDLLLALVSHPGKVLGRDQLLDMTRGRAVQAYDRSIDVQMSRLRKKLSLHAHAPASPKELIKTVRGGGYQFVAAVEEKI